MRRLIPAAVAAVLLAAAAWADHIDGHDNSDPIWPVPIPGQDVFDGGAIFISALGPLGGMEIIGTEFDITYVSDGATPASDLAIDVSFLSTDGFKEFHVTGAELGFGSGAGTFSGTLSTDALNAVVVESFLFPPYSQINLDIGSIAGGIAGTAYFENSFVNFEVIPEPGPLVLCGLAGLMLIRRR